MFSKPQYKKGFTLIELVIFIVIVSVALAGVLTVLNITAKSSADPMIRKQALAIAEALMEEVMLQPYTYCDPDDATAATATSAAVGAGGCTTTAEAIGPESGESRTSSTTPFDNVNDYHGLSTTTNIAGGGAAKYTASVTVAATTLNTVTDALLITVSVNSGSETISLQGYRTRYSPNTLP
jgi:MSHA pilin protein MshD